MHRGGRIKYSAFDRVDLYRLDLRKDGICVSGDTAICTCGFRGDTETVCERVPHQTARSWRAGGSRKRYTRLDVPMACRERPK